LAPYAPVRVAVASVEADQLERTALEELAKGHRRTKPDRG
jgi:hypothetical protein